MSSKEFINAIERKIEQKKQELDYLESLIQEQVIMEPDVFYTMSEVVQMTKLRAPTILSIVESHRMKLVRTGEELRMEREDVKRLCAMCTCIIEPPYKR